MTKPGMVKGKLSYLAPEIVNGAPATALTDLFGVGIVLWEALAGKRLFAGRSPGDVVLNVAAANVPPLQREREDLPPALVEVVHTALARKPEDRFDSADEMLRTLTAILRTHPEPTDAKPLAWSARLALARLRAG
jgi:serine/threonine-protein kinase